MSVDDRTEMSSVPPQSYGTCDNARVAQKAKKWHHEMFVEDIVY